jgi:hypothetical protein
MGPGLYTPLIRGAKRKTNLKTRKQKLENVCYIIIYFVARVNVIGIIIVSKTIAHSRTYIIFINY